MKRFLLIAAGMLLFSGMAQAQTYWNSVDNTYDHCDSCATCHEFLFRYSYTGDLGSRPDCDSCDDGYYMQPIHAENADGVMSVYNACWQNTVTCPSNCSSCSSSTTCTVCNSGYTLQNGACIQSCIQMSGSTCIACDEGYVLDNGKCLKCPDGCKSCSNSLACKTCADGYFMMTAVCYPNGHAVCRNDGKSFDGGVCLITCVESETDFFCRKATCTTASGSVQRTQKQTNFTQGTYHEYCCPANCAECSDWEQCTKCNDGYTLQNGVCVDCSAFNVGNGTCTECDEYGCTDAECNGSNTFFNPTFRKCGVECDVNQYLDSSYTCRDCPAGQTSSGGWFANPTNCYSCDSIPVDGGRCTECKNGSCTKAECEDGYVLDSMGRTCIAALASCLSPLKISDDGCCCVK